MASTFLATTFGNNLDYDLASAAQQARDQKGPTLPTGKQGSLSRTPWERAVYIFNNGLTKDEGKKFALNSSPNASLEAFLQQVSVAKDDAQRRKSKVLERIDSILERVTMYSKPMDVFAQTNQELMFAWGTMKFLMQVVMSEKEVAEKVAQAIADVVQIFGRCEQYTELFGEHERLLEAIGVLYADVLNLLVRATRFYQKRGISEFVSLRIDFRSNFHPQRDFCLQLQAHSRSNLRQSSRLSRDMQTSWISKLTWLGRQNRRQKTICRGVSGTIYKRNKLIRLPKK
jgi:hypothetical protein